MSSANNGKLRGKVAIVTASTDGIGLAIARRLGQDGAKVMVSSRKQKNVDAAVNTLKSENLDVAGIVCHVAKSEDRSRLVEETVRRFGGIDVLVCNAATNPVFGPLMNTTPEVWDKVFEVNLKSTFLLCQEVVPHMQNRGKGSIVLISSLAGFAPNPLLGAYSISKTAMIGLGRTMATELAASNIRVNTVCPGIIKTRFSGALWQTKEASDTVMSNIPLRRFGQPVDCAGIVSFLVCDEDSGYITGESVVVAGGTNSRL